MIKYIWILMLIIIEIIWLIYSVHDIMISSKLKMPTESLTNIFISSHVLALFICSFIIWLIQYV